VRPISTRLTRRLTLTTTTNKETDANTPVPTKIMLMAAVVLAIHIKGMVEGISLASFWPANSAGAVSTIDITDIILP